MQSIPFALVDQFFLGFSLSGLCACARVFLRCSVFGSLFFVQNSRESVEEESIEDDYDMEQKANVLNENN